MGFIDLHVHSNASDGTLSPAELVRLAVSKNLSAIALTDHDTVSGIAEAASEAELFTKKGKPIRLIPGIELSAGYQQKDIHILGYFVNNKNIEFLKALEDAKYSRDERNIKMAANLSKAGIPITMEYLLKDDPNAVITRAHFAKFLTQHGFTKSNKEAFDRYLNSNSPYYVTRQYLSPENAITLIEKAGGIAVLAHPLLYHLTVSGLDHLIIQLKEYGLAGIEVIYSNNMGEDETILRHLAKKHMLLMTGGSDFHGRNKPDIDLGCGRGNLKVPDAILSSLEQKLQKP